jgi:hypothetical protein
VNILSLTTTLNFQRLIDLITFRPFPKLHQLLRWLASMPSGSPVAERKVLLHNVQVTEGAGFFISREHLIEFVIIHITNFIFFSLIGFKN